MAVLLLHEKEEFNGNRIYDHVVTYLATYARPLFLR